MKTFEVTYIREVKITCTDIVEAESVEKAIEKCKANDVIDADDGVGTEVVLDEYGHEAKEQAHE